MVAVGVVAADDDPHLPPCRTGELGCPCCLPMLYPNVTAMMTRRMYPYVSPLKMDARTVETTAAEEQATARRAKLLLLSPLLWKEKEEGNGRSALLLPSPASPAPPPLSPANKRRALRNMVRRREVR